MGNPPDASSPDAGARAGAPPTPGARSSAGSRSSRSRSAWPSLIPTQRDRPTPTTALGESGRADAMVADGRPRRSPTPRTS